MQVPVGCWSRCGNTRCQEWRMGIESGSTLQTWQLLPIRVSIRADDGAVESRGDVVFLSAINGMFFPDWYMIYLSNIP